MTTPAEMFAAHEEMLTKAVAATRTREYYSAYNESPSPRVYGENAAAEGKAAFDELLGRPFPVETPGASGGVASEKSPFGFDLGVTYTPQIKGDMLGMTRQWFPVAFSDVKGYDVSKFKAAQMVVVLAKYDGKEKASPGNELVATGSW